MSRQSRFNARYWMLGVGALGRPRGMVRGRRREEGSGWGPRVYLWQIHVDIWQNKYNIVKLKNKIKIKKQTKILHAKSLSCVQLFVTPQTVAHHAPQYMEFSRQEYWNTGVGCCFLLQGIEPMPPASPALAWGCFTTKIPVGN